MSWFLYRLNGPRPHFAATMSEEEQAVMDVHAAYWREVVDRGQCLVFSPVADPRGVWGAAVVEAATEAEVEALGTDDPAVSSGTCTFEVMALLAPYVRSASPR